MDGIVQQPLFRDLAFGHVGQGADDADHLAVGADDRPRAHRVPEVVTVRRAQAEVLADAAAPLLEHGVETGLVAIALERVQHIEPGRRRTLECAAREPQLLLDLRADEHPVGCDIPVEDDVAAAGQRQRPATGVADRAGAEAAAGEGVLHDGEADEHDDEHEAADQGRRDEVVGQRARDGEGRADDPGEQQKPGRDEHHRAVVAVRRKVEDENEADAGDRRQRNARDARRHGRVVDGEGDERDEEDEPSRGDARGPHVPAAEVEIGEEEDEQGGRQHNLRAGAPDAVARALRSEDLAPETEVDADVGQYRPGERGGGGKDHRTFDDEDDGEEQREQPGDADDDAAVERQAGDLVLVGFRLPEVELRQVGRAQLGDIGDGRAGIERQAEHVGIRRIVALGREALACGDGRDAGRTEVRPDHARPDETEMRCHDQALDLLVRVVGEREDDPIGPRAGIFGADLDAPDDAVGPGRGGNKQAVALRGVAFHRLGEIDRRRVERHAGRFDGEGWAQATGQHRHSQHKVDQTLEKTHGVLEAGRRGSRASGPRGGVGVLPETVKLSRK